jgi:fucokinase
MTSMPSQHAESILQQGYRRNWDSYIRQLTSTRGPKWDLCILTASSERQAHAYRLQLDYRRRAGLLPAGTEFVVVPDPEGRRIGSGGATIWALSAAARLLADEGGRSASGENPFSGRRILLINSGGDSKRLPHYSAFGKLFARVPHELPDGRCSTLFDEFLVSLCGLPPLMSDGVMVVSGDVLLLFDQSQLDFARQGVVGVSMLVEPATAAHHGVYVPAGRRNTVRRFLHKPPVETMRQCGAIDDSGQVRVDTGIVWFDPTFALSLFETVGGEPGADPPEGSLYRRIVREGVTVNVYGDFLMPLAMDTDREAYLADTSDGPATEGLQAVRRRAWEVLRGATFAAQAVRPARFIHFGTTAEYRHTLTTGPEVYRGMHWRDQVASHPPVGDPPARPIVLNSLVPGLEETPEPGRPIIEDSRIEAPVTVGDGAILAHVHLRKTAAEIDPDVVVHQAPVSLTDAEDARTGVVTRLFGVNDNPKYALDDDRATFLNRPFREWMQTAGVTEADLWDPDTPETDRSLWTARLFPLASEADESLRLALWMQRPGEGAQLARDLWMRSDRLSLQSSYRAADHARIIERQLTLEDDVRIHRFTGAVRQGQWSRSVIKLLGGEPAEIHRRAAGAVDTVEKTFKPVECIRGFKALADVLAEQAEALPACLSESEALEDRAFDQLAGLVRDSVAENRPDSSRPDAFDCDRVRVAAAARLDFGGGWSDTPPYCIEHGGTVINAAVTLGGAWPIQVEVRRTDEPTVTIESADQGVVRQFHRAGDVLNVADPSDPLALAKAALILHGVVPVDTPADTPVEELLKPLGGGLRLTTEIDIPKGSGLGTSSILSGAILAAVARLVGREPSRETLFDYVLAAEQMLTTGGGWQDQVGGLTGGIKLVTSEPGLPQRLAIEPIEPAPGFSAEISQRLVVIYTGVRRLARNILRTVMGRFMSRDPEAVSILREIQDIARQMAEALNRQDIDTLGRLMKLHWTLNKALDPGSSNPAIDELYAACEPYMVGGKLAGAGGGGVIELIARSPESAQELRSRIEQEYGVSGVEVWLCEVVGRGYEVEWQ